jgi:outer membrane protein assembly factor BamA
MKFRKLLSTVLLLAVVLSISASADLNNPANDSLMTPMPDSFKSSLTVLPAVFYLPETKLGFGVYPNYIFRFSPDCRSSNLAFLAFYTTNKQISASFDPSLYIDDNSFIVSGTVFYEKWPNDFFGFGTNVSKDDEEEYTTRNIGIATSIKRRILDDLYFGPLFDFTHVEFLKMEAGGRLEQGEITGSEDGDKGGAGFSISWEGWDNTFYPGVGEYLELKSIFYGKTVGGDYTYNRMVIDLRKYYTLSPDNVLAFQLYGDFIDGDAPFKYYAQVGQVVRGYLPTLYIEKKLIAFQAEYRRVPIWKKVGLTVFAGAGSVSRTFSDFDKSRLKFAAGIGLRYILVESEKFNIRIDYGIGNDSAELYLAVGEAF